MTYNNFQNPNSQINTSQQNVNHPSQQTNVSSGYNSHVTLSNPTVRNPYFEINNGFLFNETSTAYTDSELEKFYQEYVNEVNRIYDELEAEFSEDEVVEYNDREEEIYDDEEFHGDREEEFNAYDMDYDDLEEDFYDDGQTDEPEDEKECLTEEDLRQMRNDDNSVGSNSPEAQFQHAAPSGRQILEWDEEIGWTLKPDFFPFNKPGAYATDNGGRVILDFDKKEWVELTQACAQMGMPIVEYIECCMRKCHPSPLDSMRNKELWNTLLVFKDKVEEFEISMEFCSEEMQRNVLGSEDIMRYRLSLLEDGLRQIDMIFRLIFLTL